MESLENEPRQSSITRPPNRIAIAETEWLMLDGWLEQINSTSKGFLIVTKADVVAFLIRNHAQEFSTKEITQMRMVNYDPVRNMQWIAPQLKVALETGNHQMVVSLQDELKQVEISIMDKVSRGEPIRSEIALPRKYKQRKKQQNQDQIAANNSDGIQDLQSEIPEG